MITPNTEPKTGHAGTGDMGYAGTLTRSLGGGALHDHDTTENTRAMQQVQGQIVMAKKFPRSIPSVMSNVLQACARKALAEQSQYSFPRGGTEVSGPSIRLAEVVAQSYGNLDFGVVELSQEKGVSEVMAYAWDLESNVRQTKIFKVKHEIGLKNGGTKKLTDERDVYEKVANSGARRLRACIMGVIPSYIWDEAVEACDATLKGDGKVPLADQITAMVTNFVPMGVTKEMLEKRLGHKIEATNPTELASLRKVFVSIRDGMGNVAKWFPSGATE